MQNGRNIQFNRGKVSYNGQTDIFCDYAVVTEADGNVTNYYFLNDRKLDNGLFIAMPSKKVPGGHKDIAHPINRETRKMFEDAIFEAYEKAELEEPTNNEEEE